MSQHGSDHGADQGADNGEADPVVTEALGAYGRGGSFGRALAALSRSRVLVPVVAAPQELGSDMGSEMVTVLLTGRDGRQAMLAFTGLAALAHWRSDARPVPKHATEAARSAVTDGAAALVVDVAGPVVVTIEGDDLTSLAAGLVLVETASGHAWAVTR